MEGGLDAQEPAAQLLACREAYQALDAQLSLQTERLAAKEGALAAQERSLKRMREELTQKETDFEQHVTQKEHDVEHQEASLQKRVKQFEEQRSLLQNMSDVLRLNIAGELERSVFRSTLCQVGDSMLAAQFSGRWDNGQTDQHGRFFINFPAQIFVPLLDFLVQKQVESVDKGNAMRLPDIPPNKLPDFLRMVMYYGLVPAVFVPLQMKLRRGEASMVSLDTRNFRVESSDWVTIVLESQSSFEVSSFEVAVESVDTPQIGWVSATEFKCTSSNSTGVGDEANSWGLDGQRHCMWVGGEQRKLPCAWRDGDVVRCAFDRGAGKLTWYVNGETAVSLQWALPSGKLLPAITGHGAWHFKFDGATPIPF